MAALLYSAVLARASYLALGPSPATLEAAIQLIPYQAEFLNSLDATRPEPTPELLRRSLELNPFQANAWIRLGLRAELSAKDASEAERCYRNAAKIDHTSVPITTLANFYARQRNTARFFETARDALALTPYDSRPLLFQARMLAERPEQVLSVLPDRQRILFEYLSLLLSTDDATQLKGPALRATNHPMDTSNTPGGLPDWWLSVLGTTENRLLQAGRAAEAMDVWKNMQRNRWVQVPTPSLDAPVANGSFRSPAFGYGFDWAIPSTQGVAHDQYPALGKLTFALDGTQPESCRLLSQFIPVRGGGNYRMSWQAESSDLGKIAGLKWRIYATSTLRDSDRVVLSSSDIMSGEQGQHSWDFVAPAGWSTALVTLEYERPFGEVRAEGSVNLREISMTSVSHTPLNTGGSL
jgi:hypothetical protein